MNNKFITTVSPHEPLQRLFDDPFRQYSQATIEIMDQWRTRNGWLDKLKRKYWLWKLERANHKIVNYLVEKYPHYGFIVKTEYITWRRDIIIVQVSATYCSTVLDKTKESKTIAGELRKKFRHYRIGVYTNYQD